MRVSLVGDDPEMAGALSNALTGHAILVDHVATLDKASEAAASGLHSAILLDRQLSDGDGLALVRTLRSRGAGIPIIVLTAKGELDERVIGLDAGADDYLAKPFAIEELFARLRAVMRRPKDVSPDVVRLGRLSFDLREGIASIDGDPLDLPRREFLVLEALIRRKGHTVQRATLEEAVYGFADEIQSNALDTHVSRLRRKLFDAYSGAEIHSVRGIGYLLKNAP